jgi:hypothetical protein
LAAGETWARGEAAIGLAAFDPHAVNKIGSASAAAIADRRLSWAGGPVGNAARA